MAHYELMVGTKQFHLKLLFEKKDGLFSVRSPNLPGLHMAGQDLDKIRADIEPIIKDLLLFNSDIATEEIRWVPSLEQAIHDVGRRLSEPQFEDIYVITGRAA